MQATESQIYSHHHFLFPFRWDILPKGFKKIQKKEDIPFNTRTRLESFLTHLIPDPQNPVWEKKPFKIEKAADYNEYVYFYSFARKSIYDSQDAINFGYETLGYFEYRLSGDSTYVIKYLYEDGTNDDGTKKIKEETLTLSIVGITLHVFNNGTGILSYNLENQKAEQAAKDKILLINELGRRIYPQFLGEDGKVGKTQLAFLALSITVTINGVPWEEDFSKFNLANKKISEQKTFLPPAYIENLFVQKSFRFHIEEDLGQSAILISRVMDDRMFFLCWYGNTDLTNSPEVRCYKSWDWWYAFIFGDKHPKSIANTQMQEEHLLKHTYARWSEYGTLYGMSSDSFVSLSPTAADMVANDIPRIDIQMNTMYYQIAVLCLAQRACILKFSAEISNLPDLFGENHPRNKVLKQAKEIYWNYMQFKNKIYLREITSQIQGIEIYDQFHHIMNIPAEVHILEDKISSLYNYLTLDKGEDMNREVHRLTWIATLFLPATFIASLFGIGLVTENTRLKGQTDPNILNAWLIICLAGLLISGVFLVIIKWRGIGIFYRNITSKR